MISEHSMPRYEGEDIPDGFPGANDPRMTPWLESLQEMGIIDSDCNMLVVARLMKGIGPPDNWVIRLEWEPNGADEPKACQ